MKGTRTNAMLVGATLLSLCLAGPVAAGAAVDNAQVVQMVELGLDEGTIEAKIGASRTNFDTSPEALLALKESGVSPQVIQSMIRADASGAGAAANTGDQRIALVGADGAETGIEPVRVHVEISHRKRWIPFAGAFMNPETFMTIEGEHARLRTAPTPSFVTAIDPLNVRLVHLGDNEEGGRYVVFDGTRTDREIEIVSEDMGGGNYRLTPAVELQPGQEYAFLVTPTLPTGVGFWGWYATPGNAGRAFDFGVE